MLASNLRREIHGSTFDLDGACRWWSPQTGKQAAPPWKPRRSGPRAHVNRDGSFLLSHSTDGQVRLFDIATGLQRGGNIPTRKRGRKPVLNIRTSQDGSTAFTADRNENVWIWMSGT